MQALRKVGRLFLFVIMGVLIIANQTQAAVSCHKINAKGIGQDLGGGRDEVDLIGGGLLQGTIEGQVTSFFPVSGTVFGFVETIEFIANKGTLTTIFTGTFDGATGEFNGSGSVTAATGKLAGATGILSLDGIEDLSTGVIAVDVTGSICVNLAP